MNYPEEIKNARGTNNTVYKYNNTSIWFPVYAW